MSFFQQSISKEISTEANIYQGIQPNFGGSFLYNIPSTNFRFKLRRLGQNITDINNQQKLYWSNILMMSIEI